MPKKNNNKKKQKKQHKKKVVASATNSENQVEKENLKIYEDDIQRTIQRLSLAEGEEDPNNNNMKSGANSSEKIQFYNNDIFKEVQRIERAVEAGLFENLETEMIYGMKREKMFDFYYEKREEQEMDIDDVQEFLEKQCYNGFTKERMENMEDELIEFINLERIKNSKKPILFDVNVNADFDIRFGEVRKFMLIEYPVLMLKTKMASSMTRCMMDYLEEKYKKEPTSFEEDWEDDEESIYSKIEFGEDISIEGLKKDERRFDRLEKSMGKRMCAKTKEFFRKQRITCKKAIKLMKQIEKFGEYRKTKIECEYGLDEILVTSKRIIKATFCSIGFDTMDKIVDDCYWFLMKQREDKGEPQLTLHRRNGSFDLKFGEVQEAARFFAKSAHESEKVELYENHLAAVLFHFFEKRYMLICE